MRLIKNIKYRIEYTVFLIIDFTFSMLPVEIASGFSGWGWRHIAPLTRRHGRAIDNLRKAFPEKSQAECDAIARDMWETLGRTFGEFFHLREIADGDRIDAESLRAAIDLFRDGGAVVCAAHLGNWEIASMGPARLGVNLIGVYQPLSNPLVERRVFDARAAFYPGGLYAKRPTVGPRAIRWLKQGGVLAILADLRDSSGVPVPFFGRPAPSTTFPARVARLLDRPLIAFSVERLPGVRFRVSAERIEVPRTGDQDEDIRIGSANLQAAFERAIRARPEQWMWAHRRWG